MAEAAVKNTEEIWTINDAFHYLVKEVGLPSQVALRQMTEKIQKARLPVWVNGHMAPRPDWMTVALSNEEAQILSTGPGLGWDPKANVFSVVADDVRCLWQPKKSKATMTRNKSPKDLTLDLFKGPLKPRIGPDTSTAEAYKIVKRYCNAHGQIGRAGERVSADTVRRALADYQRDHLK